MAAAAHLLLTPPIESKLPQPKRGAKRARRPLRGTLLRLLPTLILVPVLAGVAYVAVVSLDGTPQVDESLAPPLDPPVRAAATWLIDNARRGERLLVDDAMAGDLVRAGWRGGDVIEYDEVSSNGTMQSDRPTWWLDVDYVVATGAVREPEGGFPEVRSAIENSLVVASFGDGADTVEIRRVVPEGALAAAAAEAEASITRASFGAELAQNPGIRVSDADRALLTGGRVDERIIVVLAALASQGDVTVAAFPVVEGEQDETIRQVAIADLAGIALVSEGLPTPEASGLVAGLQGPYAPRDVTVDAAHLVLRYSLAIHPLFE